MANIPYTYATPHFQVMVATVVGYLVAWGPFTYLSMWEMFTQPKVSRMIEMMTLLTKCFRTQKFGRKKDFSEHYSEGTF